MELMDGEASFVGDTPFIEICQGVSKDDMGHIGKETQAGSVFRSGRVPTWRQGETLRVSQTKRVSCDSYNKCLGSAMKTKERCKDESAVTVQVQRSERQRETEGGEEKVPKSWGEAESQIQHLHLVGPQNPPHWIHGTQLVNQPSSISFKGDLSDFEFKGRCYST